MKPLAEKSVFEAVMSNPKQEGEYVGEVEYTFSLQDVEDARFLEKMAFFFPNLGPQNVSATLKKVFEESRDEEVD